MSLFLPELNALFIHIPKTGGTWVKRVLLESGLECLPAVGAGSHNLTWRYEHPGTRKFAFVRHPLTWLESAWRGLHESWPNQQPSPVLFNERAFTPIRLLTRTCGELDFGSFVRAVLDREPAFVTRMYEWYIGPCGAPLVEMVGRMESLAEDLSQILASLGFQGSLPGTNPANVGSGEQPEWNATYRDMVEHSEVGSIRRFYAAGSSGPFICKETW